MPGGPPPAALYHAENAKTNMDEALRQAQEAREIAQRALRDSQNPATAA